MTAQGAPPDEAGNVNLSLHLGATRDELLRAGRDPERLLIVEVNRQLPRTRSLPPAYDNTIPLDVIDVLIETDAAPFALADAPTDELDAAIARHALAYVKEGSTLQTGIGAIPNVVATELSTGRLGGFGVHSEMFTTGLMRLHQAGKVTNDAKGVFDGVSVTTFALGDGRAVRVAGRQRRRRVPSGRDGQRPDGHRAERQPGLHQRCPVGRPLWPGGRRQHRRPPDLRCRRPRGLRGRGGAASRRALAHLPALDGGPPGRGHLADRRAPARGLRSCRRRGTTPASSSPSTARPS